MSNLIGHSLGRYHMLEQLGQGGMATVFKAYDTRLEREVAVKVIRVDQFAPAVLERILKRFEREAKALAKLTHPNIVHVNDYGEQDGIPYLVMDYLPGGTLKERLGKPMPWQEATRLLIPVARALDFAHRQGLVHRDVKPSNILITADGDPLLTDFGIAKILEVEEGSTLTGTGVGIGTPEYMAPEQWTGKAEACSDIYSLGVVFYEMITGRKPYTADTPAAVLIKQTSEPLPRPTALMPDLPAGVEMVLLNALAKKPEGRYADMATFSIALEWLLKNTKARKVTVKPGPRQVEATPAPTVDTQVTMEQFATGETVHQEKEENATSGKLTEWEGHQQPYLDKKRKKWGWILGLGLVVVLLLCGLTALLWGDDIIIALFPTELFEPISTSVPTSAPTPTSTPTLGIGSTMTRAADKMVMVYVPEGEFQMGLDGDIALSLCLEGSVSTCSRERFYNLEPVHSVYLDAYWIDKTEITNEMFAICVEDGPCRQPVQSDSLTRSSYFSNAKYSNYPVIFIWWELANTYCKWAGARLPTEAEWEKAARGTDGRLFPWGDSYPTCSLANLDNCYDDTVEVGSFPMGASPYGALDLTGNVMEWVSDWYSKTYYGSSPYSNPSGPSSGEYRSVRGFGTWYQNVFMGLSAFRSAWEMGSTNLDMGFRCVQDLSP